MSDITKGNKVPIFKITRFVQVLAIALCSVILLTFCTTSQRREELYSVSSNGNIKKDNGGWKTPHFNLF